MSATVVQPPTVAIDARHYPAGTRFWDVVRHYRALGYHVRWERFRLLATRLH